MDQNTIVTGLDVVIGVLRYVFLGAAGLTGIVCAGDWLVRTRRLSPFGPAARFFRKTVDPAIAPVEHAVVRSGGLPSSAPLWALLAVIIAGIIVLSLLGVVRDNIILILRAAAFGPRALLSVLLGWTIGFLQLALIVRVMASWVRISPYSRWVRWSFILTEWLVRPLRKRLPNVGMFDISPIVAWAILWAIGALLQRVISFS
ncbi:MAG TPA: YggT family protein [Gemmatimonadaceae bacterium]|jgi:YggT family protein|nr:YggT family protein [Gemmatimonadaceae bacterium]